MALVGIIFYFLIFFVVVFSYLLFFKPGNRLLMAAVIFIMLFLILLGFTLYSSINDLKEVGNYGDLGPFGDYIGGIVNPLIAVFAVFAAGFAFYAQYEANQQQTRQFAIQARDVSIERFENKFYELLGIQRENLNEITIGGKIQGRKAFIEMFYEFRFCHAMTKRFMEIQNPREMGFDPTDEKAILDIAYHIFFMGIGNNSDKLVISALAGKCSQDFIIDLIAFLNVNVKRVWRKGETLSVALEGNPNILEYITGYKPMSGHISRLGHYFRHLFQTVNYIAGQDVNILDEQQKREYAKTLRAQLSDHEQLLLFYNVNSTLGKAWVSEDHDFIKRFRMIKNMPIPLADFGVTPDLLYAEEINYWKKEGKSFFEWHEREN